MMLPTHLVVGTALAATATTVFPVSADIALAAALMGSILPDLDLVFLHRRTLHFPVYYSVIGVTAAVLALGFPAAGTVFTAYFLLGAAVHTGIDICGGDLGLRPWEENDARGVYNHVTHRWISPKRWIPYDGSPHDFVFLLVLSLPLLTVYTGRIQQLLLVNMLLAGGYTLVRKKIPEWAPSRFK